MAAELSELIQQYHEHGLTQAAEQLRALKAGLEAQGLIPQRLDGDVDTPQTGAPRREEGPLAVRRVIWTKYGDARVSDERLDPERPFELDRLELPTRARTALVYAGCNTVSDVEFLINQGVLQRVRNIGPIGASQVTERLRRWRTRQDSTIPE